MEFTFAAVRKALCLPHPANLQDIVSRSSRAFRRWMTLWQMASTFMVTVWTVLWMLKQGIPPTSTLWKPLCLGLCPQAEVRLHRLSMCTQYIQWYRCLTWFRERKTIKQFLCILFCHPTCLMLADKVKITITFSKWRSSHSIYLNSFTENRNKNHYFNFPSKFKVLL